MNELAPLTAEEIAEIEARARSAPNCRWFAQEYNKAKVERRPLISIGFVGDFPVFEVQVTPSYVGDEPLAQFIAHAATDIRRLLDEVKHLEGILETLANDPEELRVFRFINELNRTSEHFRSCLVAAEDARKKLLEETEP